jgi:broad specificity phosphatase PhoE
MATHLILLCCAATASARTGGFASPGEPLDAGGAEKARRRSLPVRADAVWRSPARAAIETVAAMGIEAAPEDRLADMDFGQWAGRSFAAVHEEAPEEIGAWIAAPERGAPGGETFARVRHRVRPWVETMSGTDRTILAITHASTVRAVLAEALDLPDRPVMRFDVAPLSVARLSFHRAWRLQSLGE